MGSSLIKMTDMAIIETKLRRVAVIVVHGVADQKSGDTSRAVVDLLVSSESVGAAYTATATDSFTLKVNPLLPHQSKVRVNVATPTSETRPWGKALAQSYRSDFQRADWGMPTTTIKAAANSAPPPGKEGPMGADAWPKPDDGDRGLAATNYLLTKYLQNGAVPEAYDSSRIELSRTAAAGPGQVDVYEMYWADLSRLSGAIPRIVTELFTMVFRLSKLGRETIDEARRHVRNVAGKTPASWRWLAALQATLDWAFVNGLALLFAQLGMLALVIVPLGVLAPHQKVLRIVLGLGALVFGLLWLAYRRRDAKSLWIAPALLGLAGAVMLAIEPSSFWLLGLLWLGALSVGLAAALRVSDDRFPLTRPVGLTLWTLTLFLMIGYALMKVGLVHDQSPDLVGWVQAAIFSVEAVLFAIKAWWIVAAPVFLAWLVCGAVAARHGGYQGSASVGTGRLGLFVSLGTFMMLTMASWALVTALVDFSVAGISYAPGIFSNGEMNRGESDARRAAERFHPPAAVPVPVPCPASCSAPQPRPRSDAQKFLTDRYEDSAAFFSPVAALLLSLVLYLAAIFLPSVLAELKLLAQRARRIWQGQHHRASGGQGTSVPGNKAGAEPDVAEPDVASARRLGRWLTAGYRWLDVAVLIVVVASIAVSLAVGFILWPVAHRLFGEIFPAHWSDGVAFLSLVLLKPLVLSAASFAAVLTAFGGVLSRYVPSLRAPLDIALDVDNYFREFPRRSIPRARIFSRYAALLKHVAGQGYDRIVIVSHSQGTVISAEVLRFLSDAGHGLPSENHDRAGKLFEMLGAEVRLLTLGCPLRQLYAARFPSLYGWVLASHKGGNGPKAADIGVRLWANAFTSGDYVGRWLWSSPAVSGDVIGHPMVDSVHPPEFGRTDAYSAFNPMPPAAHPLSTAQEIEVCLGVGAHTHYLEPDQGNVAWLIDQLVSSAAAQPTLRNRLPE